MGGWQEGVVRTGEREKGEFCQRSNDNSFPKNYLLGFVTGYFRRHFNLGNQATITRHVGFDLNGFILA